MSANQTQVGGSHYKDMKIQPVDYIHANGIGFIEGSVIKYVSRHKSKNGKQDLEKAKHFLELLIEREYPGEITVGNVDVEMPGYTAIQSGDVFKLGDEFLDGCEWKPIDDWQWKNKVHFDARLYLKHRRPIKPKEAK